jgi:glutathione S-transferase
MEWAGPELTLYGPLLNPYVEKCRRALVLKGLAFELREPAGPEDFQRWSPKTGLLPVMTVDQELVSDSTNILLRLEELRPEPSLLSQDPVVAAQQRQLEDWADESFLFYWQEWHRAATAEAERPARVGRWSRVLRWLGARDAAPDAPSLVLRGIEDRLNDLVRFLGNNPFFYSDRVSMADLAIYAMLHSLGRDTIPGCSRRIAERPSLVDFMRRVETETGGAVTARGR